MTMKWMFKRILSIFMVIAASSPGWLPEGNAMGVNAISGPKGGSVQLPRPGSDSGISIEKALRSRRSVRDYRDEPLTLVEIGQLLWAAQGVTAPGGFRTVPSAGALYPLEVYLVAGNIVGLASGIYRYQPNEHTLKPLLSGDRRGELCAAALHQGVIRKAPAALVFSAVYARTTGKYGERGRRYVHMDHGHAAQNVYLQAVSLHLGTVVLGAFDDSAVKKIISLPPGEEPLSIMPIGRLKGMVSAHESATGLRK